MFLKAPLGELWRTGQPTPLQLTFEKFLEKNEDVSVHQKKLKVFAIEINKASTNISLELVNDIFRYTEKHVTPEINLL